MYTKFKVETWVESAMRYFTSRNFRVVGEDGKVFGYGRSIWAMIDTETRQPTDIYAIDNGAIDKWIVKDKECPIDKGGRVKMDNDAELVRIIDTYYNDVDINGRYQRAYQLGEVYRACAGPVGYRLVSGACHQAFRDCLCGRGSSGRQIVILQRANC